MRYRCLVELQRQATSTLEILGCDQIELASPSYGVEKDNNMLRVNISSLLFLFPLWFGSAQILADTVDYLSRADQRNNWPSQSEPFFRFPLEQRRRRKLKKSKKYGHETESSLSTKGHETESSRRTKKLSKKSSKRSKSERKSKSESQSNSRKPAPTTPGEYKYKVVRKISSWGWQY
jgi:hypothetical protein